MPAMPAQRPVEEVSKVNEGEKDKLKVLLEYWVKHNREHGDEFKEWAEKARGSGEAEVYDELMAAAEEMEKANSLLTRALERLA
jgi:nickel/cobalt exporter